MTEFLSHLLDAPVANFCMLGGLVFLFIAVVGNIQGRINPGRRGRIAAGALGAVLLAYGILSHVDQGPALAKMDPMEIDIDRQGGDYQHMFLPEARPELCAEACRKDARCAAYTYVRPPHQGPQPVCYLKYVVSPPTSNPCCISGKRAS